MCSAQLGDGLLCGGRLPWYVFGRVFLGVVGGGWPEENILLQTRELPCTSIFPRAEFQPPSERRLRITNLKQEQYLQIFTVL